MHFIALLCIVAACGGATIWMLMNGVVLPFAIAFGALLGAMLTVAYAVSQLPWERVLNLIKNWAFGAVAVIFVALTATNEKQFELVLLTLAMLFCGFLSHLLVTVANAELETKE